MASKEYEERKNSVYGKMKRAVESFTKEDLLWAINSLNYPSDVGDAFANMIAEKLMQDDLGNDELLLIATVPVKARFGAAEAILKNDPSDGELARLMMEPELLGNIAEKANKMHSKRLFKGTSLEETA